MLESCSAFFRQKKKLGINALDKKSDGPKTVVAAFSIPFPTGTLLTFISPELGSRQNSFTPCVLGLYLLKLQCNYQCSIEILWLIL